MPVISLVLLLSLCAPQDPDAVVVRPRLDRVTVYPGQALLERTVAVRADAPGPRLFVIGPLPASATVSSFQVKVESGRLVVQGLEVLRRTGELSGTERDKLRVRLEAVRDELRDLESENVAIANAKKLVAAAIDGVKQGTSSMKVGDYTDLYEFVLRQSAALDKRLAAYERARHVLRARAHDLEQQLGGSAGEVRPYFELKVGVFFETAGEGMLRVTHRARPASWTPIYDVRLEPDLSKVDVSLIGQVSQGTDEDWNDVELLLSTARPQVGLDPPDLPRRYVSPDRSRRNRAERKQLLRLGYTGDSAAAAAPISAAVEMVVPVVTIQDLGLTQQFRLPERVSVISNRDPKSFPLLRVPLQVNPERYIIPSMSLQAYVRAKVISTGDAPLLPGPARVFLGPDYLGKASFPVLRPGDETTLNLGVDPNLLVEYELVSDEREEPGMLSSTVRHSMVWKTRLKLSASAAEPVDVLVEESIPLSQDDRIRVTTFNIQPDPLWAEADVDDRREKGVIRWRFRLSPGQEENLRWGYTLAYDEDLQPQIVHR